MSGLVPIFGVGSVNNRTATICSIIEKESLAIYDLLICSAYYENGTQTDFRYQLSCAFSNSSSESIQQHLPSCVKYVSLDCLVFIQFDQSIKQLKQLF